MMRAVPDSNDIADRADIADLVTDFYSRAFRDELLGYVFVNVAEMDLSAHLPTMCDFWETILLRSGAYRGSAFNPHLALHRDVPLTRRHFARWLAIWCVTVDDRFQGPVADAAKAHATRVSESFQRRLAAIDGVT
jgi:hemoglobin